jgi:hypothetical protein
MVLLHCYPTHLSLKGKNGDEEAGKQSCSTKDACSKEAQVGLSTRT